MNGSLENKIENEVCILKNLNHRMFILYLKINILFLITVFMWYYIVFFYFRIGLCAYSGYKIYPGHGKTMVKVDGKVIIVHIHKNLFSIFGFDFILKLLSSLYFDLNLTFQTFTFLNSKCERAHLMKRNPRKVTWTVLYRRKHKKGQEEEATKKRTRRAQKFQRAIVGASLNDILAKRNQRPEVRKAQREQAIR